jgi:hypothetical protein
VETSHETIDGAFTAADLSHGDHLQNIESSGSGHPHRASASMCLRWLG